MSAGATGLTGSSAAVCALCGLPATRRIAGSFHDASLDFCCYGCRHIYGMVWPDLARGLNVRQAMGKAGLDLHSPCCRGIVSGDPAVAAANTLSRLMLNAFLAMMVMALSLALYADFFFAAWEGSGQSVRTMLQAIIMLFATPAVLLLALPILEDAVYTFQMSRRLTTSALIALGSLAAYSLSVYATFTGSGQVYFETATMTLLLVTLGRWLDAKTQLEGDKALTQLLARSPMEASVIQADGAEARLPIEAVQVGDYLRVRPGEHFAADGRVRHGEGSVDEASITGESVPAYKGPGDMVYAGTVNLDGSFVMEATQVGDERVMGKLVQLLEEARLKRAPIEQLADHVAAYFTPVIILLALGTGCVWTWHSGFAWGLHTSLAVLLIACPCALGVSTPLTLWAALGRAAQKGVLIRDNLSLEKLAHVRRVFLDKTGTLTTGQAELREIVCGQDTTREHLLHMAVALEHGSEHPLAQALLAAAQEWQMAPQAVEQFRAMPGLGVTGSLAGVQGFIGSWRLVTQQGWGLPLPLRQARSRLEAAGLTVVHVGWHGTVQGLLGFAESLRLSAPTALTLLQRQGLQVRVLTGDSAAAGGALGQHLGVTVQSELLPHDKVQIIDAAEQDGPVAMLGDGLNDAPALARASVGIALGCGTDMTREAADIRLIGDDLTQVAWALALARRTYRTIAWNLSWAFAYNVVGVGLAMAGMLHPVLAASAMVLSSALVVSNALRIRTFESKRTGEAYANRVPRP
ncbi:MAG: heavy metal translocating P-type ATPase [Candidatus Tectimicrobiota bacterium]